MKILLVAEGWSNGGTETYIAGLARTLISQHVDVSLLLLSEGSERAIDFLPAGRVIVVSISGLAKYLRSENPDVVNLHLYARLLPAMLICKTMQCKVVATLHMPIKSWGLRHRLCSRLAMNLADKVVGVSSRVVEEIDAQNGHPSPLPGGVENVFFNCERRLRERGGRFHIAAIGRLAVEKDWPTLIEGVAHLPADLRARAVIDFYGGGPRQADLKALAVERGVAAVFHGHVERPALVNALALVDLAVLPSRFEGLGLSALESMAAGVPTVTADFAAASEFIEHGVTGHMFPVGNAFALAQVIAWHIDNPEEAEAVGLSGREYVLKRYSEEAVYRPYLEIFGRVMSQ